VQIGYLRSGTHHTVAVTLTAFQGT
jgi:hypothetical protein